MSDQLETLAAQIRRRKGRDEKLGYPPGRKSTETGCHPRPILRWSRDYAGIGEEPTVGKRRSNPMIVVDRWPTESRGMMDNAVGKARHPRTQQSVAIGFGLPPSIAQNF